MARTGGLTPMMEQYNELKGRYPEALLMIRLGDFYEFFNEDAEIASRELGLYLTGREVGTGNRMPMCGVPHHALDEYLPQLVKKGYRVAIAEQLEDPKVAKGLVKRDIIRLVSPGVLEGDGGSNNYMASIFPSDDGVGIAYCDVSTGEFRATQAEGKDFEVKAVQELERLSASEILLPSGAALGAGIAGWIASAGSLVIQTPRPEREFEHKAAARLLSGHFGAVGLEGYGLDGMPLGASAAGALLAYLKQTQKSGLEHISSLGAYRLSSFMHIDRGSWRNLAVFGSERALGKGAGLLDVLDTTLTKMGARMLKSWLEAPLLDIAGIGERQDSIEELMASRRLADGIKDSLSGIQDMERLGSKLAIGNAMPRDLAALGKSLDAAGRLKASLASHAKSARLSSLGKAIDPLKPLSEEISAALADELPADLSSGGYIRKGYDAEVDELRDAAAGGRGWLATLEARERERSGIKNLRIGFNGVFGYYFEVSKSNIGSVPSDFIRKQTLPAPRGISLRS